jgi:hypothetical protein
MAFDRMLLCCPDRLRHGLLVKCHPSCAVCHPRESPEQPLESTCHPELVLRSTYLDVHSFSDTVLRCYCKVLTDVRSIVLDGSGSFDLEIMSCVISV